MSVIEKSRPEPTTAQRQKTLRAFRQLGLLLTNRAETNGLDQETDVVQYIKTEIRPEICGEVQREHSQPASE
ncbi:MAG: hypothetical protein ACRC10_04650 [Thermoguttaceae bacterium]